MNMRPTSLKRRRIYFIVFSVIFICLIPVVTLIANGYRFNGEWKLVATGGISLDYVPRGTEVFLDYKQAKPSIFAQSFFLQNLLPRSYFVVVAKQGYWSWAKHLSVNGKRVSNGTVLLIPQHPVLRPIASSTPAESLVDNFHFFVSSSTADHSNPEYAKVAQLFSETSPVVRFAAQNAITILRNGVALRQDDAPAQKNPTLYAEWRGSIDSAPDDFCNESYCVSKLPVYSKPDLKSFDFYPGRTDVVLLLTDSGLYALEIDARPEQNMEPIYLAKNLDFRIDGKTLYVRDGQGSTARFFEVVLD